jgi:Amt family ammonium transporter
MKSRNRLFVSILLVLLLGSMSSALAQTSSGAPADKIDSGDTAFMLVSAALVLLMTIPGLALFYGGMVRTKNALGTLMQSFIMVGLITIQWVLWGYSIAFAPGSSLVGSLQWFGLQGVGLSPNADYAATIPHQLYMVYQLMFAIITPALITGAFAERMKFSAFLLFSVLWATIVYDPLAHWVWGSGGWLHTMGALDFAGGTVVHLSSGISALIAVMIIGKRYGYGTVPTPPHNLPFTVIGAGLLWVGWFGFNAGSALAASGLAVSAFIATHVAAAAAALSWVIAEWVAKGKPTMLGAASGAVAGLVAITPASGFVSPLSGVIIGLAAGALCYSACVVKARFGYDDSLDVVGVHGVGGAFGAIATGIFASKAINPAGADGLIYGNVAIVGTQIIAVLATIAFAVAGTAVILFALKAVIGLRVTEQEERLGLDLSQHSESAYTFTSDYDEAVSGRTSEHAAASIAKPVVQKN